MSAISKKNYFEESDLVLLLDRKSRKYLITLNREQIFHSHLGQLFHDQLINKSGFDAIYHEHFSQVEIQLTRKPRKLPRLEFKPKDFFSYFQCGTNI